MKVRDIKRRAKSKYVVLEGQKFLRECCAPRCRTYVAGCVTCDSWRFYDENGRFTRDWPELHTFIKKTEAEQERLEKHEAAHEAARKLAEGKEFIMGDIDVPNAELTDHLNQDLDAKLARWLSSRLDAREVVRTHHVYTPSPDADTTEWELNNDQPSREAP